MAVGRRRLLQTLALAGPLEIPLAMAQQGGTELTGDVLQGAAAIHGTGLSGDRLRVVKPMIERRLAQQLKVLRRLEIDDAVEPTQGL